MKTILILLATVYCAALVTGRNVQEVNQEATDSDGGLQEQSHHEHATDPIRHPRRPRQSYYNSNGYYNPMGDHFGRRDNRRENYRSSDEQLEQISKKLDELLFYQKRDYDNRQAELFGRILNVLEELSVYVKKAPSTPPPPPPAQQIIYVPFPYIYPLSNLNNQSQFPSSIEVRAPSLKDIYQNWGQDTGNAGLDIDNGANGKRPINLKPVETDEPTAKPPPVEHGSSQAGTSGRPKNADQNLCKAAILICCQSKDNVRRRECFDNYSCSKLYSINNSCHPDVVKRVVLEFSETYAPINDT